MGENRSLRTTKMPASKLALLTPGQVESYTQGILTAATLAKYRWRNVGPMYFQNPVSGRIYYAQDEIDRFLTAEQFSGTRGRKKPRLPVDSAAPHSDNPATDPKR